MKSFRQHLRDLEKKRKEASGPSGNGIINSYVHGKHAMDNNAPSGKGISTSYVHGKHSNEDIIEALHNEYITDEDLANLPDTVEYQKDHPSKQEIDERLGGHYHTPIIEHPDKRHAYDYTKSSALFNNSLIKNFKLNNYNDTPLDREDFEARKHGLDRFLTHTPSPEDIVTYSGLGYHPFSLATSTPKLLSHLRGHEHLANMPSSDEFMYLHSPAYTSSSVNFITAKDFAKTIDPVTTEKVPNIEVPKNGIYHNHIARILVPKGSKMGSYVNTISNFGREHYGVGAGELEYLHPRGVTYKVRTTPSATLTNSYGRKNTAIHIWDFEPVASIHPGLIK